MNAEEWAPSRLDEISVPLSEVRVGDFIGYDRTRVSVVGRDSITRISVAITVDGHVTASGDEGGLMLTLIRPVFDGAEVSP